MTFFIKTLLFTLLFWVAIFAQLSQGFGYSFPSYYSSLSGVKQDAMAGVGYSMQTSINALSLSSASIGFNDEPLGDVNFGYSYSISPNSYYYLIGNKVDVILKPFNKKDHGFGVQINNLFLYDKQLYELTMWDESTATIIGTGETVRDYKSISHFILAYGKALNDFKHSLGFAFSFLWNYDNNFGEVLNYYSFYFDISYSLKITEILKTGLVISDLPLGKLLSPSTEVREPNVDIGILYSIGVDTKQRDGYRDKPVNVAAETYYKYIISIASETYYKSVVNDIDRVEGDMIWGSGLEILIKDKLFIRNGLLLSINANATNTISFPFGFGFRFKKLELDFSYSRIRYYDNPAIVYPLNIGVSLSSYRIGSK